MYDLTQFIVFTPTYNITAENLAKLFMEEVFLNFVTCSVIVIEYVSNFKGNLQKMCRAPKITYWSISRGNHKGNSDGKFSPIFE